MQRLLFGLFIAAASPAAADDCPTFGLDSDYLNGFFCGQLAEIAGPKTRTIEPSSPVSTDTDLEEEWFAIDEIRDAYRVDPARTLEMIRRIKNAGGEPIH